MRLVHFKSNLLLLVLILTVGGIAEAQRGGFGGFRGGRRSGGGLVGVALSDAARSELQLTEEQIEQLREISESTRPDFAAMQPLFERMRNAESDEQREAAQAELRAITDKARVEAEQRVAAVLGESKTTRLRQLNLQQQGVRGLLDQKVGEQLKLSDEQRQQLESIQSEMFESFRDLRGASEEERDKSRESFETRMMDVLSDSQKQQWQAALGPPAADSPAATASSVSSSPAQTSNEAAPVTGSKPAVLTGRPDQASNDMSGEPSEVIASFGATPSQPNQPQKMSFNFQAAPWQQVMTLFARSAGLNLHIRDLPPGSFNYLDPAQYSPTEAIDVLNGYLLQEGYLLVVRDRSLVCLGIDEKFGKIPPNLIPNIAVSDLQSRGKNEMISVILPLQGMDADQAAAEIQSVLGPLGRAVALKTANSLYVEGLGSNVRQVYAILESVVPAATEETEFQSYQLENILAVEAERQVRALFGLASTVQNVSASSTSNQQRSRGSDPRFRDPRQQQQPQQPQQPATQASQVKVASDARTNSLLVTATSKQHELVKEVIRTIDVPEDPRIARITSNNLPILRVYTVKQADATEVTKTLNAIMPGVVVNEDGRNGLIHIQATPLEHQEVEELIRRLDGGSASEVDIIRLWKYDPAAMAAMLNSVFLKDGTNAPTIQAESLTRTLVVRGSKDQIAQVRQLLLGFGEDGTEQEYSSSRQSGRVRTIPLGGRDPVQFAKMLEQMVKGTGEFGNDIRIIVPTDSGPAERVTEPEVQPQRLDLRSLDRENRGARVDPISDTPDSARRIISFGDQGRRERTWKSNSSQQYVTAQADEPTEDGSVSVEEAETRVSDSSPITIRVAGGDLVIYSTDESALDRLEDMIADLSEQIPYETNWTVFYLRSADATEASAMLEQLIPSANIATVSSPTSSSGIFGGIGSSISSLGSSLMDMSGLSDLGGSPTQLKIIPDLRSNSLFVTGPAAEVRNVEKFLQILDSSEIPGSLRDRIPRTIPVLYADVNDVAEIVRQIYQDYLEDPRRSSQQRGQNPFAAMMGGGGGGGTASPGVRLTLAVDSTTNELIVSCDDSTYRAIEELVYQRDLAAYEARRTVKVVTLSEANSVVVQQALTSLIPRVNVSTSGRPDSSRTTNQPSTGRSPFGGPQPGGGDAERAERIRQFMQMRGGGAPGGFGGGRTGGSPGGGRTGGFGGSRTGGFGSRGGGTSPFGGGRGGR